MKYDFTYLLELIQETSIGIKGFLIGKLKMFLLSILIFSLGLYIIDAPYYGLIGILIALVDILPIVGSGIILLPWSVFSLVQGNSNFGFKLILLYIIAMIVRQILEPKILGDSIGLRPIYTLVSTLLGSLFFGPMGVFIGPIIAIILNTIYLKESLSDLEDKNKHL